MWFGLAIMIAMIVGLVLWCIWAMRSDQARTQAQEPGGEQPGTGAGG